MGGAPKFSWQLQFELCRFTKGQGWWWWGGQGLVFSFFVCVSLFTPPGFSPSKDMFVLAVSLPFLPFLLCSFRGVWVPFALPELTHPILPSGGHSLLPALWLEGSLPLSCIPGLSPSCSPLRAPWDNSGMFVSPFKPARKTRDGC